VSYVSLFGVCQYSVLLVPPTTGTEDSVFGNLATYVHEEWVHRIHSATLLLVQRRTRKHDISIGWMDGCQYLLSTCNTVLARGVPSVARRWVPEPTATYGGGTIDYPW
jgi:hypothetical protein